MKRNRLLIALGIIWTVLFAGMSFYWAAGGMLGVRSLGGEIYEMSQNPDPSFIRIVWNELLIFAGGIALYILVSTWWLKKKYRIRGSKGFFVTYVNDAHKYIEWTFIGVFLLALLFIADEMTNLNTWTIPFILVLSSIRLGIQWVYNRDSKEYILELNGLITFVVFLVFLP